MKLLNKITNIFKPKQKTVYQSSRKRRMKLVPFPEFKAPERDPRPRLITGELKSDISIERGEKISILHWGQRKVLIDGVKYIAEVYFEDEDRKVIKEVIDPRTNKVDKDDRSKLYYNGDLGFYYIIIEDGKIIDDGR